MYKKILTTLPFLALFAPILASAHEVYVLTGNEIAIDSTEPAFNMLQTIRDNLGQFVFWGFIASVVTLTIFAISISRRLERLLDPYLKKMKPHAPMVARVTAGLGLLASAYYGALFGPELPFADVFGSAGPVVDGLIALIGIAFIADFYTQEISLVAVLIFLAAFLIKGAYMFTYSNYLGEFLVLLIGAHASKGPLTRFFKPFAPYSFVILRAAFGLALLYASLYAKVIHNNLAFQVASLPLAGHAHSLAYYFGFEPHFLVLGAAIIEIIIGLFFVLGIEIRHTALFMEFWLFLSLLYFGESVWPHLILIGIPIALFMHGYDRYSLEGRYFKRGKREPVL